ncbi:MAG: GatB/YqeY domain-containing protein [Pseudomonadota bacterium]|nr:GatB/YqeY domain-containing protein [Pseudomonadota bacterium]
MSLKDRIQDDMKAAMRSKEKARLATIRMLLAAIKQVEVDSREAVDDAGVLTILEKMVKQRREAAEQYDAGGRAELADKERAEIDILADYLPTPLTEAEITDLVSQTIAESGAESVKDMGKVMAGLKSKMQGRADMAKVSALVRQRLSG